MLPARTPLWSPTLVTASPELIDRARGGDPHAAHAVLLCTRPLIRALIKRHVVLRPQIDRDDLDRVAEDAVCKALKSWKPERGAWPKYVANVIMRHLRWYLWRLGRQSVPTGGFDPVELSRPVEHAPPALDFDASTDVARISPAAAFLLIDDQWHLLMQTTLGDEPAYYLWPVGPDPARVSITTREDRLRCDCSLGARGRYCGHLRSLASLIPSEG